MKLRIFAAGALALVLAGGCGQQQHQQGPPPLAVDVAKATRPNANLFTNETSDNFMTGRETRICTGT